MKPGRCFAEQPGVKAPGTEKTTTFLSAHSAKGRCQLQSDILACWVVRRETREKEAGKHYRDKRKKRGITFAGIVVDGDAARGDRAALWGVRNIAEGSSTRDGVANFESSRHYCCVEFEVLAGECERRVIYLFTWGISLKRGEEWYF
jgi:hypothetical protein